jgi:hypothetical protein
MWLFTCSSSSSIGPKAAECVREQEAVAGDKAMPDKQRSEALAFLRGELVVDAVTARGAIDVSFTSASRLCETSFAYPMT